MTYHFNYQPWRNAKLSQKERVRLYLEAGHSLTPKDALDMFGSFRLSAIIHTLRHEEGMDIVDLNAMKGAKENFSRYRLATKINDNGQVTLV